MNRNYFTSFPSIHTPFTPAHSTSYCPPHPPSHTHTAPIIFYSSPPGSSTIGLLPHRQGALGSLSLPLLRRHFQDWSVWSWHLSGSQVVVTELNIVAHYFAMPINLLLHLLLNCICEKYLFPNILGEVFCTGPKHSWRIFSPPEIFAPPRNIYTVNILGEILHPQHSRRNICTPITSLENICTSNIPSSHTQAAHPFKVIAHCSELCVCGVTNSRGADISPSAIE